MNFLSRALSLLALFTLAAFADPTPQPVFTNGADGYHTYRIPSLLTTKGGTVLAFAEGRKKSNSDAGDIDLVYRRSTDGGKTWGPLTVLWDDAENTCGNPCPAVDATTGKIHLLLTWNSGTEHEKAIKSGTSTGGRRPYYSTSADDGLTWSQPVDLSAQADRPEWRWYATGPGRGIQLTRGAHKGRLLIPANHSRADGTYDAHALWSDDAGKTWQISKPVGDGANESTVVELSDGRVVLNTRIQTNPKGFRGLVHSADGGTTWSVLAQDPTLTCPRCEASLLRYAFADEPRGSGKSVLLFCNPAGPGRSHLTLRASLDEGATWPHARLLHADPGPGYTSLTVLPDDRIGVFYETKDGLFQQTLTLAELLAPPAK
jgi:sialidase-1